MYFISDMFLPSYVILRDTCFKNKFSYIYIYIHTHTHTHIYTHTQGPTVK